MGDSSRIRVIYSGNVQGVGFRATARSLAKTLPVKGYVKNLQDGCVELVAEGEPPDLDALIERIRSRMSEHIRNVAVEREASKGDFKDFSVRF
jgi:acylphosphatase